jgi:NTE family protein
MSRSRDLPPTGTAVVLGAGGLLGQAFHLGVLTALAEVAGVDARRADILVGTSAGSLVASGLAAGLSAAELRADVLGGRSTTRGRSPRPASSPRLRMPDRAPVPQARGPLAPEVLLAAARWPFGVRAGAVASGLLPAGRLGTSGIRRAVHALHADQWPDRDLRLCAVRARDGRRVVFGTPGAPRVDVGTAVSASCAIPGFFTPVQIDGDAYVDGGAHSPTNADVVLRERPALVLISSPMTGVLRPRADVGLRLAVRRYLAHEVRRLRRAGSDVVVFQPGEQDLEAMGLNPMAGGRAADVVATAAASTRARLEARSDLHERLRTSLWGG